MLKFRNIQLYQVFNVVNFLLRVFMVLLFVCPHGHFSAFLGFMSRVLGVMLTSC